MNFCIEIRRNIRQRFISNRFMGKIVNYQATLKYCKAALKTTKLPEFILEVKTAPILIISKIWSRYQVILDFFQVISSCNCIPLWWLSNITLYLEFRQLYLKNYQKISFFKRNSCNFRICMHAQTFTPQNYSNVTNNSRNLPNLSRVAPEFLENLVTKIALRMVHARA